MLSDTSDAMCVSVLATLAIEKNSLHRVPVSFHADPAAGAKRWEATAIQRPKIAATCSVKLKEAEVKTKGVRLFVRMITRNSTRKSRKRLLLVQEKSSTTPNDANHTRGTLSMRPSAATDTKPLILVAKRPFYVQNQDTLNATLRASLVSMGRNSRRTAG